MYKVEYDTVAIMNDGSLGNISQGKDVAYMDCHLSQIDDDLQGFLRNQEKPKSPVINNVVRVKGHLIRYPEEIMK